MKTLKFLLPAAIFLAAFSFTAKAQNFTESEADPYNREIGFGTNILLSNIFNSESAPLDFIFKWGSRDRYWRLGTSIYFSKFTDSTEDLMNEGQSIEKSFQSFSSTIFLGKEWRNELAKRWLLNYGADLNLSNNSSSSFRNHLIFNDNDRRESKSEVNQYNLGVRPFIGILFKVNQRLFLGTEASFIALVQRHFSYSKETYFIGNSSEIDLDRGSESEANGWRYSAVTRPASNIFLYYRF